MDFSETDRIFKAIMRPIVAVLLLFLLTVSSIAGWFAVQQNDIAQQNSRDLARAMLGGLSRHAYNFARDYAYWDDAIENIFIRRNEQWIRQSYLDGIDDIDGLDGLFIIDRSHGIIMEYPRQTGGNDRALSRMAIAIARYVAETGYSAERIYTDYTSLDDKLYVWGAFPFIPMNSTRVQPGFGGDIPVLVIYGTYTDGQLQAQANAYNLQGVSAQFGTVTDKASLLVKTPTANPPVSISWHQTWPGSNLIGRLAPAVLVVGALAVFLFLRSRRITAGLLDRIAMRERLLSRQQSILAEHALPTPDGLTDDPLLIDRVLEQYCDILEASRVSYWSLAREQDVVTCRNWYSTEHLSSDVGRQLKVKMFPAIDGVVTEGGIFTSEDVSDDPQLQRDSPQGTQRDRNRAVLFCPVAIAGDLKGVLFAERHSRLGPWRRDDIIFSRSVANVLALILVFRQLENARAEALQASEAKSAFLANMSHELRTPLNAIIGFSELMMADRAKPMTLDELQSYVRPIHESGQHLLSIVRDVLDLSALGTGKQKITETEVDLKTCIEGICSMFELDLAQKQLSLEIEAPRMTILQADERLIGRCLANLLSNAIKFTAHSGHIRVGITHDSDTGNVCLYVSDDGKGMTAEEVAGATEAFGQGESHLARQYGGTGLGLTLVQKIVTLHGGELTLESQPGQGTKVSLLFPAERCVC